MDVNRKGLVYGNGFRNKKDAALRITRLIDTSVALDPRMGIEIDAQYPPAYHCIRKDYPGDGAYITHNIPKWERRKMKKREVMDTLHQNTIRIALDHMVRNNYYRSCRVYVELKIKKECYGLDLATTPCDTHASLLARELAPYAATYAAGSGSNWICVTSFSPRALVKFREALPDTLRDKFDYVLITGYTGSWAKGVLAQAKGFVPEFGQEVSWFAASAEWLDCIWFSAQGIKDFDTQFALLNHRRRSINPDWKELEYSFSTYQYGSDKMVKKLTQGKHVKLKIRSFMPDVDYQLVDRPGKKIKK